MSETKIRYYHLFADGKTVREISREEHREIWMADLRRKKTRRLCRVRRDEVIFFKGGSSMYVPMAQLRQILGDVNPPKSRAPNKRA
ncbi:hypothetical protein ES703_54623 [subsurface metagenome]